MRFWSLALRNLRRNVRRNLATGSAIALGFAGICLLIGYTHRVDQYLRVFTIYAMHMGHLNIYVPHGLERYRYQPKVYSFDGEQQKKLEQVLSQIPDLEFYERQLSGTGMMGNGCVSLPFMGQGYEPQIDQRVREHAEVKEWMPHTRFFIQGRGFWNFDEKINPLVVSKGLAAALGKTSVHDDVQDAKVQLVPCEDPQAKSLMSRDANVQLLTGSWNGAMNAMDGEVVAIFSTGIREADNSALYLPLTQLQKLLDTDRVGQYAVWLKPGSNLQQDKALIESKLQALGLEVEILPWSNEQLSPYYVGTMQFLLALVTFVGSVLAAIVTLSVLNSMTITVLERLPEIGMYRSIGFRKDQVSSLFVRESFWLVLFALAAGGTLGRISIASINASKIIYHPPAISGGLQLVLIPYPIYEFGAALLILVLALITTQVAVKRSLTPRIYELIGGIKR